LSNKLIHHQNYWQNRRDENYILFIERIQHALAVLNACNQLSGVLQHSGLAYQ